MVTAEKRGFIRVAVDLLVTIETCDSKSAGRWTAKAVNVSLDGVLLGSLADVPANTPLLLRFPAEWDNIAVQVAPVWREGAFYGCKFLEATPETRAVLDRTIYQHWRRSIREGSLPISSGSVPAKS